MEYKRNKIIIQKSAGIILGVFLFVFSVVGACLFSPVSSQAAMHVDNTAVSHMGMDSSDFSDHIFTPIHPDGDFFAMNTSSNFLFDLLFLSISVLFAFTRIPIIPFIKKKWHQFLRWAELHYSHSPYLLLLQDGIVHPKIF